jgi:hypothetical protein
MPTPAGTRFFFLPKPYNSETGGDWGGNVEMFEVKGSFFEKNLA